MVRTARPCTSPHPQHQPEFVSSLPQHLLLSVCQHGRSTVKMEFSCCPSRALVRDICGLLSNPEAKKLLERSSPGDTQGLWDLAGFEDCIGDTAECCTDVEGNDEGLAIAGEWLS